MPRSSRASSAGAKKRASGSARSSRAKQSASAASKATRAKRASKSTTKTATKSSATKSSAKRAAKKSTAKRASKSTTKTPTKTPHKKSTVKQTSKKAASASKATAKKATAVKAKSPFPAKWLAQQQQALTEERETYLKQFESLRAEADSLVADYEPGDVQFDEESGEGDTLSIERERDLTLSNQARQMVEEIDAALVKIQNGTYGICEASGEPIPKDRLEAIPWARVRVEYKTGGLASRH